MSPELLRVPRIAEVGRSCGRDNQRQTTKAKGCYGEYSVIIACFLSDNWEFVRSIDKEELAV